MGSSSKDIAFFVAEAFQLFFRDDSSSEDEEDEETVAKPPSKIRPYILLDNTLACDGSEFKAQFRVNRSTVQSLSVLLEKFTNTNEAHMGRPAMPMQTQLLVAIWVLTTQESYRQVSERFSVAKSTAIKCVHTICTALVEMSSNFIAWPVESKAALIAANFQEMSGMPMVIGCIDRVCIPTKVIKETNPAEKHSRTPFVILQAVCDDKMMITDCYAAQAGSGINPDFQKMYSVESNLCRSPEKLFYGWYHLLGNSSYSLSPFLLTPYGEQSCLNKSQVRYNSCHSNTMCSIERTFELLRARFRRLNFIDMNVQQMICVTVMATCILHNFCLINDDSAYQFLTVVRNQDVNVPTLEFPKWHDCEAAGQAKRAETERFLK